MSENLLTYVIIFAEMGAVLLLLSFIAAIYFFRKHKNEGHSTKDLILYVKELAKNERDDPSELLNEEMISETDVDLDTLMADERQLYQHLVKFSINKDTSLLKSTTTGIHSLIGNYIQLLSVQSSALGISDSADTVTEKGSKSLTMKKENEALRSELAALEVKLQNATDTIESMMGEYSSMYEGGKEEGDERTEKEMKKIKRKINDE